jgi:sec-independent protein translocase protein TatB
MFDIAFSELMVIAVVALVIIGPERLPGVARTLGHLFGRLQRYVNDVKADISREIELDELRKFKNDFEQAAHSVESEVKSHMSEAETSLAGIAAEASLRPQIEQTEAELAALARDAAADPHANTANIADTATPERGTAAAPAGDAGTVLADTAAGGPGKPTGEK